MAREPGGDGPFQRATADLADQAQRDEKQEGRDCGEAEPLENHGCAALVGAGEIEMAIGGDQGGSIRMPAGWCGVYGMKPTHGLVPYTGVMPIECPLVNCHET